MMPTSLPLELSPPAELLPLLEGVVRQFAQALGTPHAYLYAPARGEDALEVVVAQGMFEPQRGFRIGRGQGLGGAVWESGESLLVPDYDGWNGRAPHYPKGQLGPVLGLPLRAHGQVVGAIGLGRPSGEPGFERADLERLRPFAELASLALENAGLRGVLERAWQDSAEAGRRLRVSQSRLDGHSQVVPLPLLELDPQGWVRRWNAAAEETFGYRAEEAMGRSVGELILDEIGLERARAFWRHLLERGEGARLVGEAHTKGGAHLVLEWTCTPLYEDGGTSGVACVAADLTRSRRAEERVRILEAAAILVSDAIIITRHFDNEHRIVYVNGGFEKLTGYTFEEVEGLHPRFLARESEREMMDALERHIEHLEPVQSEMREWRKDGSPYWCEISLLPIRDDLGRVEFWVSWRRDITARKRLERMAAGRGALLEKLLRGEGVERTLLECAALVEEQCGGRTVFTRLHEGRFVGMAAPSFPPEFLELLSALDLGGPVSGWTVEALERGAVLSEDIREDRAWSLLHPFAEALSLVSVWTWPIRSGEGSLLGSLSVVFPERRLPERADRELLEGAGQLAALCIEHGELQEKLERQTYHDALTGLPNRAAFERELNWTLEHLSSGASLAVMLLDLDGFKAINDACGHEVGDALLKQVAEALRPAVGPHSLFRMGGDEYALIARGLTEAELGWLAETLRRALDRPFFVDDLELFINASVGMVQRSPALRDRSSLLRAADTALYRAKDTGRNLYVLYRPEMEDSTQGRLERAVALRRALEKGEFTLHYQPQVSKEGHAVGVEALLRWKRPEGFVPPSEFIPIAEETGLIAALGEWVLEEACAQASRWHAANLRVGMAVNISALHFARPEFVDSVKRILRQSGLEAEVLELELTESIFVGDLAHTARKMRELRELGVRLYLDDFGTGYSSLSYLRGLPLDGLKIDRSFVHDLEHAEGGLAGAIVGMARQLGLETVAEGVESAVQLERLTRLGCERLQGFLFAHPMPPDAVERHLRGASA